MQESVVNDALQYPLSSKNLADILSILKVLANSGQIEALNYLMEELLLQLQKQENFHFISELVGEVRVSVDTLLCIFLIRFRSVQSLPSFSLFI